MNRLPDRHAAALERLLAGVPDVDWTLTGSTSFALRGDPLEPDDVEVQTDAAGARAIEDSFSEHVTEPVEYVESERMRSYLGALELDGVEVELIGELRKRDADGAWEEPVDVTDHREFVEWRGTRCRCCRSSRELRRTNGLAGRSWAALLRAHVDRAVAPSRRVRPVSWQPSRVTPDGDASEHPSPVDAGSRGHSTSYWMSSLTRLSPSSSSWTPTVTSWSSSSGGSSSISTSSWVVPPSKVSVLDSSSR